MKIILPLITLLRAFNARTEDGYDHRLRYRLINDAEKLEAYRHPS